EGKTWTGSIQAVKSLVLSARKPVPEHFAPRRAGDDSNATPDCTATHGPVTLATGETVRERWARFSPDRLDAARTRVVVEAVEHGGRAVRIETPTAELITPDPEVPAPRPSPGERFDRAMKDAALREAIAAEPA